MNVAANILYDDRVLHLKSPAAFSHLRFEWHPGVKRVFVIRLGVEPLIGEPFAYEIEDEGAAWNAVLIFLRGHRAASMWGAHSAEKDRRNEASPSPSPSEH